MIRSKPMITGGTSQKKRTSRKGKFMENISGNCRVLCTAPQRIFEYIKEAEHLLDRGIELIDGSAFDEDKIRLALPEMDAWLSHYFVPVTREIMSKGKKLRLIQTPSVGYQHFDLEGGKALGIPMANAAGFNSVSVAEHAIMLMLAALRNLPVVHQGVLSGDWQPEVINAHLPMELSKKIVGIVGLGRIGKELAKRLRGFECNILYYDTIRPSESVELELDVKFCDLEEIFRKSDLVTVHVPLLPETRQMIAAGLLSLMKPSAIFLNTSRGEVVNERNLYEVLKERKIRGAALDVFGKEPIEPDNPLLTLDNVVLTSHKASTTAEAISNLIEQVCANLSRVARGERPENIVNGLW